jgi:hypothetical protein
MDYQPWWVGTSTATRLHADISNKSAALRALKPGQPLLALSASDSESWLRVYDPADRAVGFVNWRRLYAIPTPPIADSDAVVRRLSIPPGTWPTVVTANRWIRLATWGIFAVFGLIAAWKSRDVETFQTWVAWYFIAALLTVVTQIWPWYVIWPLAFGALRPGRAAIQLALLLSATLAMSYALLGFCNTRFEWLFDDRSLFTIVLPVALFAIVELVRQLRAHKRASLLPAA